MMVKRSPRAIGTSGESALVAWLRDNGWPEARRQPLYGSKDQGDIILCEQPKCLIEVKAGAQAEQASDNLIDLWLEQTDLEAVHAGADLGLLVEQARLPVGRWDVYMRAADWMAVLTGDEVLPADAPWPMRMQMASASHCLSLWVDGRG